MARLYADEDFPLPVVVELRRLGHDELTVQEAGRSGQGVDDADVFAEAAGDQRAVPTHNHADFRRLHPQGVAHEGIISCTQDPRGHTGLASRIDAAVAGAEQLANQFLRVIRPNPPDQPSQTQAP